MAKRPNSCKLAATSRMSVYESHAEGYREPYSAPLPSPKYAQETSHHLSDRKESRYIPYRKTGMDKNMERKAYDHAR
jgi:hypothetical protein